MTDDDRSGSNNHWAEFSEGGRAGGSDRVSTRPESGITVEKRATAWLIAKVSRLRWTVCSPDAVPLTFNIVAGKGQVLIAGEKVDRVRSGRFAD